MGNHSPSFSARFLGEEYLLNQTYPLPALGCNPDTITMAGQSSGSYMTNHLTVIYSDRIKGSGMMEGGPYHDGLIFDQHESKELLMMESVANMTLLAS